MRSIGRRSGGYTIVEVTLFLAITTSLLAVATTGVGRQQRSAQFTDATRQIEAKIKDELNDVTQGKYGYIKGRCEPSSGNSNLYTINTAFTSKGECVFLGKVVSFTNDGKYTIYTLAAQRNLQNKTNPEPKDMTTVRVVESLTESGEMLWGLNAKPGLNTTNYTAMFGLVNVPAGNDTKTTYTLRFINYATVAGTTEENRIAAIKDTTKYTSSGKANVCFEFPPSKLVLFSVANNGTSTQVTTKLDNVSCD